ncbi:MAG: heparinase II/III family protein [Bauldia sp.]|nr:heparinase II/III family protein [Bauldia sp.]
MAAASTSGQTGLAGFALAEAWRGLAYGVLSSPLSRLRPSGRTPERLLIAPTDLRTADPTAAAEIYAGRFAFGGELADAGGASIFEIVPPSEDWARQLHGFGWLRHLRASDMALSRPNARALVADWIRLQPKHPPIANEPDVLARRVIAWLAQTPLLLEGCDEAFYWRFLKALTRQVRQLRRIAPHAPKGLTRLRALIALSGAALSMNDRERVVRQAVKWLDAELSAQVLPDGGHISRNPRATLDLLVDLLPLRQAFTARGIQPSPVLLSSVDRMMPMLRFFRHGDGSFARFNGTGDTPVDLVATVLAYDDARGKPFLNAPHSGYQRIVADGALVIMDTGRPPPIGVSAAAHAGCLSFEFSVGKQPIVVNCGVPHPGNERLRRLARTTAAHSTATLNDASSCRFLTRPRLSGRLGEVIVSGPETVEADRQEKDGSTALIASHDGYAGRFAVVHQRRLALSAAGDELRGEDAFVGRDGRAVNRSNKDSYTIRFHLHPTVSVSRANASAPILLTLPGNEIWEFVADTPDLALEDGILFSDIRGNRRSHQIVIYGRAQHRPAVAWRLRRIALPDPRPPTR